MEPIDQQDPPDPPEQQQQEQPAPPGVFVDHVAVWVGEAVQYSRNKIHLNADVPRGTDPLLVAAHLERLGALHYGQPDRAGRLAINELEKWQDTIEDLERALKGAKDCADLARDQEEKRQAFIKAENAPDAEHAALQVRYHLAHTRKWWTEAGELAQELQSRSIHPDHLLLRELYPHVIAKCAPVPIPPPLADLSAAAAALTEEEVAAILTDDIPF